MHFQVSDGLRFVRTTPAGSYRPGNEFPNREIEEKPTMSDENLGDVLDDSYRRHKREVAIKNLGERTNLTLEQVSKLCSHTEHGDVIKTITLRELLDAGAEDGATADPNPDPTPAPRRTNSKKKTAKKATTKSSPKSKAAAKKTAKKRTAKKATKKATSSNGRKADFGKKKPRLNYEQGCKEIVAALKAHGEPAGRSELEDATGYSGVQVRTFCKRLAETGKVKILGKGGRSTRYDLP